MTMERGYCGSAGAQIHYVKKHGSADGLTIICLHPTPFSGRFYETFMGELAENITAIAPDMPGFGGSYKAGHPMSIEERAAAFAPVLAMTDGPVHLVGYHTGALLAGEMAIQYPEKVAKIAIPATPFFVGEKRAEMLKNSTSNSAAQESLNDLAGRWKMAVGNRKPGVSFARAYDLFIEAARAGETHWWGYKAAFEYECEKRFPLVQQPALCVAINDSLAQGTRDAAAALPNATLLEAQDILPGAFEAQADVLAQHIMAFFTGD